MSAGPNEARASWSISLQRLRNELLQVFRYEEIISSEESFRAAFESLPATKHNNDIDGNYAYFHRYHVQIRYFIRIIDEAVGLQHPNTLSDVFWTVAFAAIKVSVMSGCHHRC